MCNKKLLLEYEEGYGDKGFDLVECVNDKNNEKIVFMVSYNFDGSVNFVELLWGKKEGNEEFIKVSEDELWKLEDIFDWEIEKNYYSKVV